LVYLQLKKIRIKIDHIGHLGFDIYGSSSLPTSAALAKALQKRFFQVFDFILKKFQ
jgi:hypothetical protein